MIRAVFATFFRCVVSHTRLCFIMCLPQILFLCFLIFVYWVVVMGKDLLLYRLAKVLAEHVERRDRVYDLVEQLVFVDKSYEALRVGIHRVLGKIPEDVEEVLREVEGESCEFFFRASLLLPDLIKSIKGWS